MRGVDELDEGAPEEGKMQIEKEKRRVCITCDDGSIVRGFVHINPGERLLDFFNDSKKNFIAVTHSEFYNIREVVSLKVLVETRNKKPTVLLHKAAIKFIEEV